MGERDLTRLKELVKRAEEELKSGEIEKHLKTLQLIGEHVYLIASMEGISIKNSDTWKNELVEA